MTKTLTTEQAELRSDVLGTNPAEAFAHFLSDVVRVITGQTLPVEVDQSLVHPAATNGKVIFVSGKVLERIGAEVTARGDLKQKAQQFALVKGLVYHELSHVLWTFRGRQSIWSQAQTAGLTRELNILEDQRIETLLVAEYPHRRYLTAVILRYVLSGLPARKLTSAHLYTYGRRYLPDAIRLPIREAYQFPQDLDAIEAIIDEFETLDWTRSGNQQRGIELSREFGKYLAKHHQSALPDNHHRPPEVGSPRKISGDLASDVQEEIDADRETIEAGAGQEATEATEDAPEGADGTEGADGAGDGSEDATEASEGDSEGGATSDGADDLTDGKGPGGGETAESDDESDADGASQGDDAESHSASSGGAGGSGEKRELSDLLNEFQQAVDDAYGDIGSTKDEQDEALSDLKSFNKALRRSGERITVKASTIAEPVPPWAVPVPRRVALPLQKLIDSFGARHLKRQNEGSINALDYRSRKPGDGYNVFDQFKRSDRDSTSFDVVVLVDYSFSTYLHVRPGGTLSDGTHETLGSRASLAAWIVKSAVDSLPRSQCTVLSFNGESKVLYTAEEDADRRTYKRLVPNGGTDPTAALKDAARILSTSTKANKLVIILTDGEWSTDYTGQQQASVEYLNDAGVVTAIFGFGDEDVIGEYGLHHCSYGKQLPNVTDLPKVTGDLIAQKLQSNKRHHRR